MKQKDIFLQSEGDAYYKRSLAQEPHPISESDPIVAEIKKLALPKGIHLLEVGCSDGDRLAWMAEHLGLKAFGVEPSAEAVKMANLRGSISVVQGTADQIPFEDRFFDVVVFGFCLYLCDPEDLFRIAVEADRVLKDPGWMIICDFYSPMPVKQPYRHREGVWSHKMDYRSMFLWHPYYVSCVHRVVHWRTWNTFTDDRSAWASVSVLRKNSEWYV